MRNSLTNEFFNCKAIILTILISILSISAENLTESRIDHPEWLWFDDFETTASLKTNYQDVNTTGLSVTTTDAISGTHALQQHYTTGMVDAGWIIKVENNGFPSHLFMRFYHKFESGFTGIPQKMARIRYRQRSGDWASVFAVHCWVDNNILVQNVKATNSTQANSSGWLSIAKSNLSFADAKNIGRWVCIEMEVLLNTPGKQDGLYRMWADNTLIIERLNVDLRGSETELINEVMLDCYWGEGSPKEQNRYYDNFVISKERIGMIGATPIKKILPAKSIGKTKKTSTSLIIDKSINVCIAQETPNNRERKFNLNGALIQMK